MNYKPLVSIVTIFLNEERFIDEAIESVFAQTYEDWELLLVDDGSSDGSTQMAQRYADASPGKVRYLQHENHQNRGMSASRNLGIRHAKGEYVAFLDADDVWLPQKLERQVEILKSQPDAAMLFGHTLQWFSWTGRQQDFHRDYVLGLSVELDTLIQPPRLFHFFVGNFDEYPCICSIVVRREALESLGCFEDDIELYDDRVLHAKFFLRAPALVSSECWDKYRQKPESSYIDAQRRGLYHPFKPHVGELVFLSWLQNHLIAEGIKNRKVWRIVHKKLWRYHHPILYRPISLTRHLSWKIRSLIRIVVRRLLTHLTMPRRATPVDKR